MPHLSRSEVLRHAAGGGGTFSGPRSAPVATAAEAHPNWTERVPGLRIEFEIAAGGRGRSTVIVWISPDDFDAVADLMMKADPVAAQKAFGAALVADAERQGSNDDRAAPAAAGASNFR